MSKSEVKKVVYILGAGASKAIGLPLQTELLPKIFSLKPYEPEITPETDFMSWEIDEDIQEIHVAYPEFDKCRQKLACFIIENFASQQKNIEFSIIINEIEKLHEYDKEKCWFKGYNIAKEVNVALEDLFTIFDKIAVCHEHFRIYSARELEEIHDSLKKCIIFILVHEMKLKKNNYPIYASLASKLIKKRMLVSQKTDILSVITMNWDTAFEKVLYEQCCEINDKKSRRAKKVYIDLCFYDNQFSQNDNRIISTQIKAKGHYNIKYLKMHGSLNWLVCPCCGRVFVDFKKDIALKDLEEEYCTYCSEIKYGEKTYQPKLKSMLITPTFLKEINDLHLKNIWHNAFIDIVEASEIVFIGYSFPDADFEMRCLLKKAVRSGTKITVVLHESDNPQSYENSLYNYRCSESDIKKYLCRLNLPQSRYENFFGKDNVNFLYEGIEGYLR